jgi:hypothetical protein
MWDAPLFFEVMYFYCSLNVVVKRFEDANRWKRVAAGGLREQIEEG